MFLSGPALPDQKEQDEAEAPESPYSSCGVRRSEAEARSEISGVLDIWERATASGGMSGTKRSGEGGAMQLQDDEPSGMAGNCRQCGKPMAFDPVVALDAYRKPEAWGDNNRSWWTGWICPFCFEGAESNPHENRSFRVF